MKVLRTQHVNAWYGNHHVLKQIDVSVEQGTWTCVVGPNGAGKTTLLKVLAGLFPFEGEVWLNGQSLFTYPLSERAKQLAWLSQHDTAVDDLTVQDVVMLGRLPYQSWWGSASPSDRDIVEECLLTQHISQWRERSLSTLSGGERQRVLLARMLAVQAPLMLMDEPIANVDIQHQSKWLHAVQETTRQGNTVVSVLHDLNLALRADQVIVMQDGRVVLQSTTDDPQLHQCLQQTFEQRLRFHRLADRWVVVPD